MRRFGFQVSSCGISIYTESNYSWEKTLLLHSIFSRASACTPHGLSHTQTPRFGLVWKKTRGLINNGYKQGTGSKANLDTSQLIRWHLVFGTSVSWHILRYFSCVLLSSYNWSICLSWPFTSPHSSLTRKQQTTAHRDYPDMVVTMNNKKNTGTIWFLWIQVMLHTIHYTNEL